MTRNDKYGESFMITKAKISKEKKMQFKIAVIEDGTTEESVILDAIDKYLELREKKESKK